MEKKEDKIRLVTIFLGIFLILVPLDSFQIFGTISILRIFAIIPIVLSIFYAKDFKINKNLIYLFVFVFYVLVQILYTINVSDTISRFIMFAMYFLLIFFCTSIEYNEREIKFLNRMFAYSSIIASISILFWGFFEEGRLTIHINSNTREDENQFCGYFLVGTVFFIKNIVEKRRIFISSICVVLFLFIALLTGSRGGILAIALAVITYLLFYSKSDKNKLKKLFIGLIIGILILILISNLLKFLSPEIAQRFSLKNVQESGGTGRTDIWKYYLNVFDESPALRKIFGYGSGTVLNLHEKVPHNNWIQLLIENGIVGEIIFVLLIISFLKTAYKNNNIYLFSVLIGYIGLTISLSLFSYKPLWGVMLIILLKPYKEDKVLNEL